MNSTQSCTVSILFVASLVVFVRADLFSSLAKLEPLVETEKELLQSVEDYVRLEKERLLNIERLLGEIKEERKNPSSVPPTYEFRTAPSGDNSIDLGNPIQTYLLVRRLQRQWTELKRHVADSTNQMDFLGTFTRLRNSDGTYPTREDLTGAIKGLLRLQEIYQLKTTDVANGILLDNQQSAPLIASDCYEIGRVAWTHKERIYPTRMVAEWMKEALNKGTHGKNEHPERKFIRNTIAKLLSEAGNGAARCADCTLKIAMNITHHFIDTDTEEDNFERVAATAGEIESATLLHGKQEARYFALCRGDMSVINKPNALCCRYTDYDRPELKIQPAKEEILATEPTVVYYHDMLTEREMELLKERALPQLHRSSIGATDGSDDHKVKNEVRVSNIAWLPDLYDRNNELGNIVSRLQAVTGLNVNVNTSEPIQVANYGMGGHYHPHYDDDTEGFQEGFMGMGKRIATVLYYLSDVHAGGATVFIKPGLRVPPVKGSAVLWYNYLKNGEKDLLTQHAGCPVLMGSKWASNLWIRENGQFLRRKCGLTRDDVY